MHREIQVFRLIVVALLLGAVGLGLYSARMAFIAHSHGRSLSTQVVALVLTGFFVMLAAVPAWIAYLLHFRFLTAIDISSDGYVLQTRALQREHATQLSTAFRLGGLEGPSELTVVRVDGRYWVCRSATLVALTAAGSGGLRQ